MRLGRGHRPGCRLRSTPGRPPQLPPQSPSQYRAQSEALRGTGTPCTQQAIRCTEPVLRGSPDPSPSELPVHYIQVQIIGPRVQHPEALSSQTGQVAVEDGRANLAAGRHSAGSQEQVTPRVPRKDGALDWIGGAGLAPPLPPSQVPDSAGISRPRGRKSRLPLRGGAAPGRLRGGASRRSHFLLS